MSGCCDNYDLNIMKIHNENILQNPKEVYFFFTDLLIRQSDLKDWALQLKME